MLVYGILNILEVGPQTVQVQIYLHQLWDCFGVWTVFLLGFIFVLRCTWFICRLRGLFLLVRSFVSRLSCHVFCAWTRQSSIGATSTSIISCNVLRSWMLLRRLLWLFFLAKNATIILSSCCSCNANATSHKLRIYNSSFFPCNGRRSWINLDIKRVFKFLSVFLPLLF
jgi:hypothetical protein